MLARLILALLLAAFVTPSASASAACHDGAAMTMTMAGEPHSMPATPAHPAPKAIVAHACIGCIPPSDWIAARVAEPLLPARAAPIARIVPLALRDTGPPALPPPRLA